jgi:hypothetical protein
MTMLRAILLLLFLAAAADGAVVDSLRYACGRTPHPDLCVSVLSAVPESRSADARGLAVLAIRAAAKMAASAAAAADAEKQIADDVNAREHNGCTAAGKSGLCFYYCGGVFKVAEWLLEARNATDEAGRFASARFYFQGYRATPYRQWECARYRVVGRGRRLPTVISKGSDTQRFMEVTSKLVALAPGGSTAPLPPPSEDVYEFLNRADEDYVHFDDCRGKEPTPPKCLRHLYSPPPPPPPPPTPNS